MPLTKAQRAQVRALFDGRCAYCGEVLGAKFHADHIEPIHRDCYTAGSPAKYAERDTVENQYPACVPCNIDKSTYSLEQWREVIKHKVNVLRRDSGTYRHAVRFGLVVEVDIPVVFHFERVKTA